MKHRRNTSSFRHVVTKGMDQTSLRFSRMTYESSCFRVIEAFVKNPTKEALRAAVAALDEHEKQFMRWIEPHLPKPTNKETIMENFYFDGSSNMSIQVAVAMGFIARGTKAGTVVIKGLMMPASAAVGAGFIDQKAADFIGQLPFTNEPAPHTREDAAPPPEEVKAFCTETTLATVSAYFANPTGGNKRLAAAAIEAHHAALETVKG